MLCRVLASLMLLSAACALQGEILVSPKIGACGAVQSGAW